MTRGRRGVALVEMAIVLSLLLLLVFGMIDLGLMLKDSLALNHVSFEAARSAALGADWSTVQSSISGWAADVGLQYPNQVGSTLNPTEPQPGQTITVTLTYPHKVIMTSLLGLSDTTHLQAKSVSQRQ